MKASGRKKKSQRPPSGGTEQAEDFRTRADSLADRPVAETLAALGVDPDRGLSPEEARSRLDRYGYNETAVPRKHPLVKFLKKFWGLSAWMLELIMVLSAALRKYSDLLLVGVLLTVNAVLGFLQEQRAAGVVETLRRRLRVGARVLRDGNWRIVAARELVPGDVIRIRPGDIVPADAKLISGELTVDQSAITGESIGVERAPGDVLSSGSVVRRGEGNGVVLLTGKDTFYGRTTELVAEARPRLHVEAVIAAVVRRLFLIVGLLLGIVVILSRIRGIPLLEILPLMLVLLMAAVPVALPVMFTVSMAVGSNELAKRGVLVTRLGAVEDAATMDVLCVDKTGTITANRLAVRNVIPLGGATESDVLSSGAFASQEADQDPIDLAFLRAVKERPDPDGPGVGERIGFIPFDAGSRRTEAVIRREGRKIRVMKGALRSIARVCGWTDAEVRALEEQVAESTSKGYRTLAVAAGPESDVPALIGLVTMYDPPRPDAGKLITRLSGLGVPVKMLTGDALPIAREIAGEVGLAGVRRLKDVESEGAPDGPLTEAGGLAEVYPEDKYLVVRRLQAAGRVVGMTGDGVNDAPALRQAEVGIAVAEATDVAKGAASVVLTEPGLTNILALVEQGRTIYQRILTWVVNKISRTVLKAGFVSIAFVLSGKFVISAFAMLLLVFMNDFAKIALAYDKARPSKRPETWNIGGLAAGSAVLGAVMVAETLLLLWFGWSHFGLAADDGALSTFSFLTLLYFAVFSILSARERRRFWATLPSPILLGALLADAAIGTILTFTGLPGFSPLPAPQILAIFLFAMICCLTLNDAIKVAIVAWRARRAARKADAG